MSGPRQTLTTLGTARSVSFLKVEAADEYAVTPMMVLLCLVSFSEGIDAALFPSVTKALEVKEGINPKIIGQLAFAQFLAQALAGPMWGIIASRAILTRARILTITTFFQGLATMLMWMNLSLWVLLPWRCVNGVMLAGLRPIANSIVGDRFDDEQRGRYFGFIMSAMQLGVSLGTLLALPISQVHITWIPTSEPFWGWKLAFIIIGLFTIALSPAIHYYLRAPPVTPKASTGTNGGGEFAALGRLLMRPTFAMLVFQGMFGLIPWRAFDFRSFFLQTVGINDNSTTVISLAGGLSAVVGSFAGGLIGDRLGNWWPLHGRVLTAEISVYGGIPIAFFSFMVFPSSAQFVYYFTLTAALGLVAPWTPAGCNSPVMCTLCDDDERALILSWQTSLEGIFGALGPLIFTYTMSEIFEYDTDCASEERRGDPECTGNISAVGKALFWTSCVPWTICGLMYSSLHWTYPRDLAAIDAQHDAQLELAATNLG